jgi:hypothetical protein
VVNTVGYCPAIREFDSRRSPHFLKVDGNTRRKTKPDSSGKGTFGEMLAAIKPEYEPMGSQQGTNRNLVNFINDFCIRSDLANIRKIG